MPLYWGGCIINKGHIIGYERKSYFAAFTAPRLMYMLFLYCMYVVTLFRAESSFNLILLVYFIDWISIFNYHYGQYRHIAYKHGYNTFHSLACPCHYLQLWKHTICDWHRGLFLLEEETLIWCLPRKCTEYQMEPGTPRRHHRRVIAFNARYLASQASASSLLRTLSARVRKGKFPSGVDMLAGLGVGLVSRRRICFEDGQEELLWLVNYKCATGHMASYLKQCKYARA